MTLNILIVTHILKRKWLIEGILESMQLTYYLLSYCKYDNEAVWNAEVCIITFPPRTTALVASCQPEQLHNAGPERGDTDPGTRTGTC